MASIRQRKTKKSRSSEKSKNTGTPPSQGTTKVSLIFRLLVVASLVLFAIYAFKRYYVQNETDETETEMQTSTIDDTQSLVDFTQIINSEDLDLSKTKVKEISRRFSAKKKKRIPSLRYWKIDQFWTNEMALNISTQLYDEFMDESIRNQSFYFAINSGNEKIRSNDNIAQKTLDAHALRNKNRFAYCKYEYRRTLPLYQRVLSYLNNISVGIQKLL